MNWLRICALLALLLPACLGTDVGNPEDDESVTEEDADGTVALTALPLEEDDDDRPPRRNRLTTDDGVKIVEAWVAVDSLRFCQRRSNNGNGNGNNEKCQRHKIGPAALNLLTGQTLPSRTKAWSKAGAYDTVTFTYAPSNAAGARSGVEALRDAAIYIRGKDSEGRPFTIIDDRGGEITFEPQGGVELQREDNLFALELEPDAWLPASLMSEVDGDTIVISRASNSPIFAYFETALHTTTDLIRLSHTHGDDDDERYEGRWWHD